MKKSKRGFTLIELLATIVILGILFLFAAPAITGMVSKNRDKMYVNDAKKLMSQAEYKIKSASTSIEKPNPGDCIVISMVYLESDDFDEAPNRGEYLAEASYVVVKNSAGKLEYSVAITEKLDRGGYKGILLTKGDALHENNAAKYVTGISDSELVKATALSESYINKRLGGGTSYVSTIDKVYNDPDLQDSASKGGLEAPVIVGATLSSTSGKEYNSLDATLTLTVEDKDTSRSDLTVYISKTGYSDSQSNAHAYGSKNAFTYDFNFADDGLTYEGGSIDIYVLVKDKEGNEAKITLTYEVHQNKAPEFDPENPGFFKLPGDKVNRAKALLKLVVTDDIDANKDMKVCMTENTALTECNDYKDWNTVFGADSDEMEYQFNIDKCALTGQEKQVKVFVKDTFGKVSAKVFTYKLHNDANPTIRSISVVTEKETFLAENATMGSLNVKVKVNGSDDVSYNQDMKVTIGEAGSTSKTYNEFDPNAEMEYTINGKYDGSNKKIRVTLTDECGHSTTTESSNYTLYKNKPPKVENIQIESDGYACKDETTCPTDKGGSKDALVYFDISDDLDYSDLDNKTSVCVSENKADCNNADNFKPYLDYVGGYSYTFSGNNVYNGSTKRLYVITKDSYGETNYNDSDSVNSQTYLIYKNKAPTMTNFQVVSDPNDFTSTESTETHIFFAADDDMDEVSNLRYTIGVYNDAGKLVLDNETPQSLDSYNEEFGIPYHIPLGYDGKTRKIEVTIYDLYGGTTSQSVDYKVYQNQPPQIYTTEIPEENPNAPAEGDGGDSGDDGSGDGDGSGDDGTAGEIDETLQPNIQYDNINIVPKMESCHSNYVCPYLGDAGGNPRVEVIFDVQDDIDSNYEEKSDLYLDHV